MAYTLNLQYILSGHLKDTDGSKILDLVSISQRNSNTYVSNIDTQNLSEDIDDSILIAAPLRTYSDWKGNDVSPQGHTRFKAEYNGVMFGWSGKTVNNYDKFSMQAYGDLPTECVEYSKSGELTTYRDVLNTFVPTILMPSPNAKSQQEVIDVLAEYVTQSQFEYDKMTEPLSLVKTKVATYVYRDAETETYKISWQELVDNDARLRQTEISSDVANIFVSEYYTPTLVYDRNIFNVSNSSSINKSRDTASAKHALTLKLDNFEHLRGVSTKVASTSIFAKLAQDYKGTFHTDDLIGQGLYYLPMSLYLNTVAFGKFTDTAITRSSGNESTLSSTLTAVTNKNNADSIKIVQVVDSNNEVVGAKLVVDTPQIADGVSIVTSQDTINTQGMFSGSSLPDVGSQKLAVSTTWVQGLISNNTNIAQLEYPLAGATYEQTAEFVDNSDVLYFSDPKDITLVSYMTVNKSARKLVATGYDEEVSAVEYDTGASSIKPLATLRNTSSIVSLASLGSLSLQAAFRSFSTATPFNGFTKRRLSKFSGKSGSLLYNNGDIALTTETMDRLGRKPARISLVSCLQSKSPDSNLYNVVGGEIMLRTGFYGRALISSSKHLVVHTGPYFRMTDTNIMISALPNFNKYGDALSATLLKNTVPAAVKYGRVRVEGGNIQLYAKKSLQPADENSIGNITVESDNIVRVRAKQIQFVTENGTENVQFLDNGRSPDKTICLSTLIDDIRGVQSELALCTAAQENLEDRIYNLEQARDDKYNTLETSVKSDINAFKTRVTAIETSVSDLGIQISSYIDESVQDQINTHPKWDIYRESIRKIQDAFVVNNHEMVTLAESVKNTENAQLSMTQKFGEFTSLTSKLDEYKTAVENYRTQLSNNNGSLRTVNTQLTSIQSTMEDAVAVVNRIHSIEISIQTFANELSRTNTTVNVIIDDMAKIQTQLITAMAYILANMATLSEGTDTTDTDQHIYDQAVTTLNTIITREQAESTIMLLLEQGEVQTNSDMLLPLITYSNPNNSVGITLDSNTIDTNTTTSSTIKL